MKGFAVDRGQWLRSCRGSGLAFPSPGSALESRLGWRVAGVSGLRTTPETQRPFPGGSCCCAVFGLPCRGCCHPSVAAPHCGCRGAVGFGDPATALNYSNSLSAQVLVHVLHTWSWSLGIITALFLPSQLCLTSLFAYDIWLELPEHCQTQVAAAGVHDSPAVVGPGAGTRRRRLLSAGV